MDRPDIYSDAERPERCANCLHVRTTVFRSVYGTERVEYECMRRPEFIHRTQGEARGGGDPMDASGARDQWNRGPIQIRAEVA